MLRGQTLCVYCVTKREELKGLWREGERERGKGGGGGGSYEKWGGGSC